MDRQFPNLEPFVEPKSIVVYGVSEKEGSIGYNIYQNLAVHSDFDANNLYLINPKYDTLFGSPCYKSCLDIQVANLDLAIIAVSANQVFDILEECNQKGITNVIIISSGFAEIGGEGRVLQEKLKKYLERTGMKVYGPNTGGLTNIVKKLGMTFSPAFKHDTMTGSIGVVTQGGGMGRTIVQGMSRGIGFAYFFSPGNEVDIELSDFIHYMIFDPKVKVITALIEGLKDPEKFKQVARLALEHKKPIVLLKVGQSELGQQAALSHTGALAGSDEVFNAICNQYGIIRANDLDELLEISALLGKYGVRESYNTAVLTVSGGAGSITADICGLEGINLPQLKEGTVRGLEQLVPSFVSINNPIDLTATALTDTSLHTKALSIVLDDPDLDIIFSPINADYGKATRDYAEDMINAEKQCNKMIIPIWMSSKEGEGFQVLNDHGMIPFRSIGNAVNSVKKIKDYSEKIRRIKGLLAEEEIQVSRQGQQIKMDQYIKEITNGVLDEYQSKSLLKTFGVPTVNEILARDKSSAIKAAETVGYPVALKVVTPQILHKTEAGIIRLNLNNRDEVAQAYDKILENCRQYNSSAKINGVLISEMVGKAEEFMIGLKNDPEYGPVVTVGLGGVFVEVLKDIQMAICPVTKSYAREMVKRLKGYKLLQGYRGEEKDIDALCEAIEKVSFMGIQLKDLVEEVDMNPLMVLPRGQGVKAVDGLIVFKENVLIKS